MNEDRCCKKNFLAKPMGNRPRAKMDWLGAEKDLNILKINNWKTGAKKGAVVKLLQRRDWIFEEALVRSLQRKSETIGRPRSTAESEMRRSGNGLSPDQR
ncbi:hypothetical protein TNCV_289411 [Trichonephila clavipes]|nr:hypothetical protein TNCV_289411 [Trichonephila clavipes]